MSVSRLKHSCICGKKIKGADLPKTEGGMLALELLHHTQFIIYLKSACDSAVAIGVSVSDPTVT